MLKTATVCAGVLLLVATSARAQTAPTPARPLTTEPGQAVSPDRWTFTEAPFDGYDHIGFGKTGNVPSAGSTDVLQRSGQRGGFSTTFGGTQLFRTGSFSFIGKSTTTYLFSGSKALTDASASASQSKRIGPRTSVAFGERFTYAPYFSLAIFPDLDHEAVGGAVTIPIIPTFPLGISTTSSHQYDVGGLLSHAVTDQTVFEGAGSLEWTRINPDTGGSLTGSAQTIGARVRHRLSQAFGYHLGYGYEHVTSAGTSVPITLHNVDVGIDFRRPLSSSRRTIVSFSTGLAVVRNTSNAGSTVNPPATQYRVLVNADLEQYIGRTWTARVSYRRDYQVLQSFSTPFFRNAVTAGIGGKFNTRTAASVKGSFFQGNPEGQPGSHSGHAFTTTAYVQMAITEHLAAFAQYTFYQHRFDSLASALNLPPQFERNSVRFGLAVTVPTGR